MRDRERQDKEEIEAQAIRRLIALLDDPSPAAQAELADWIMRDPAHGVAYARAEAAWEQAERLKADGAALAGAIDGAQPDEDRGSTSRRGLLLGAAAAAACGAAFLCFEALRPDIYQTAVGEVRDITLADGSILHLNTASRVEVAYRADRRLLRLIAGEAYFDVAHDPARPFEVAARNVFVRALGTAFNVRLRDAVVELTVTNGLVGVDTPSRRTQQVPAGQGAIVQPRAAVALARLDRRVVGQRTAWRERMIELDGESVAQAVEEFNRYRAVPVVVGDQRLVPMRIGGRFRTDEAGAFIAALEQTLPIRAVGNSDGSVLLLYREDAG